MPGIKTAKLRFELIQIVNMCSICERRVNGATMKLYEHQMLTQRRWERNTLRSASTLNSVTALFTLIFKFSSHNSQIGRRASTVKCTDNYQYPRIASC